MINKIILIGRLGDDPQLRIVNDDEVATFSLATSNGKDSKTQWHDVEVWGKTASNVISYTHKGSLVYVEGQLIYPPKYELKDQEGRGTGQFKYPKAVIRGNRIQFLQDGNVNQQDNQQNYNQQNNNNNNQGGQYSNQGGSLDDMPQFQNN